MDAVEVEVEERLHLVVAFPMCTNSNVFNLCKILGDEHKQN